MPRLHYWILSGSCLLTGILALLDIPATLWVSRIPGCCSCSSINKLISLLTLRQVRLNRLARQPRGARRLILKATSSPPDIFGHDHSP